MTKEPLMGEYCSHCGQSGHDSRTCHNGDVGTLKIFGVTIDPIHGKDRNRHHHHNGSIDGVGSLIRKCKSLESLEAYNDDPTSTDRGYQSGPSDSRPNVERTKGVPWTEDEHISFLMGLEKLGKGDWRGISKKFVPSRTHTQVASHAQKHFIRMNTTTPEKRKRRSSLFDMPFQESAHTVPRAPVPISVRPPVSPVTRTYEIQDFSYRPCMLGYTSNRYEQRLSDPKSPMVLPFVPTVSYPNQDRVCPVSSHGTPTEGLTGPTSYVSRPSLITYGSSRSGNELSK